ncbi:MAG: sigma-70 family RNA polymerase sigma factor [Phycisphaera sp. RhM]|nr:sigma-70 family RNA polymerase sigma factor [Phycisphaera sp. RhM]
MSLLERAKSRDEQAWKVLTELYGPLIYHWCRRSGLREDDSADLMQEVFRSLVIHVGSFEKADGGSFRAWLWTITRNRIRDFAKVHRNKAAAAGGTDAYLHLHRLPDCEPEEGGDSGVTATGSLTYRTLHIVRKEVQEQTWLAFWRTTIDGISPAAVAQELSMSIESVWQSKSRVLRRVRQLLE